MTSVEAGLREGEIARPAGPSSDLEQRIDALLREMTLEEKIGQLTLVPAGGGHVPESLREAIRAGRVGAILNEVQVGTINELQRVAVEESRLGVPLLVGRDVIHGFKTVFPIPLGQAASWNSDLIESAARIAALEAAAAGINWTFAPMVDIGRDPRWGRVAECLGEDPWLSGVLATAMVRGFQGQDLANPGSLAACAKHFAGYGASESGRDYNTTSIPEHDLRNIHLPPFRAALDAGVASIMTSFSDLNGVPATGNEMLLTGILRDEWRYDGFVVSDWESVRQLAVHGLTGDDRESAWTAASAGCDMEMASTTYADHIPSLVQEGRFSPDRLDRMVANVLRAKFRLGLFEGAWTDPATFPAALNPDHLRLAYHAAVESLVLLKNDHGLLPLSREKLRSLAVIGPLADDPHEQLGTWVFDGVPEASQTALPAIRLLAGEGIEVHYARGVATTRSRDHAGFAEAIAAATTADAVILFLGEEAILSGEAHCRADIGLPGAQEALIDALAATGRPIVLVVMAGRPLALERVVGKVQALLYAWHPGTMGGPAIADLLFGVAGPSGRLPVTLPRVTGQIPIYYAHKQTGKPATAESMVRLEDIEARAPQVSVGNTSFHLDAGSTPLFSFGFGLSYTTFEYADIRTSSPVLALDGTITISADVTNTGGRTAEEVVQLYVRDPVGSITRPVRELKAFEKVRLEPGERQTIRFVLSAADLAFHGRDLRFRAEPGRFQVWIGGSSEATLQAEFVLADAAAA